MNESQMIHRLLSTVSPPWPQIHTHLRPKKIISNDRCIHRKIKSTIHSYEITPYDQTCPPRPAMFPGLAYSSGWRNTQICSLVATRTKPHRYLVLLQTAHDYPTPVSCHRYSQAAECTRLLCRATLPHQTPLGRVAHGWRPCGFSRNSQPDMYSR